MAQILPAIPDAASADTIWGMDLDEQVAEWTSHSAAALDDVVAFALRNRDRIMRASLARLHAGYGQYGDAMFRADDADSERDLVEGLADAVNYRVSRRARREADSPTGR